MKIPLSPENVARFFHETYEELAPYYNYETRKDSAVPWEDVPEKNKALMIAVAAQVIDEFFEDEPSPKCLWGWVFVFFSRRIFEG